jgi:hypothetical protein
MLVIALGADSVAPLTLGLITKAIVWPDIGFPLPSIKVAVRVDRL